MSWHHYYDHDFLGHLSKVNPELAKKLYDQRHTVEKERTRLVNEYQDALAAALLDNLPEITPLLRPCHKKDVEEGRDLRISTRLW